MICDAIKNIQNYKGIHQGLDRAIDFLIGNPLDYEVGSFSIEEKEIFANVMAYEPKDLKDCMYETHKVYADIQVMLEGKEAFYNGPAHEMECVASYDAEKDMAFYKGEAKEKCILEQGNFIICMPTDAHMPGIACGAETVKKMVVKVKLD